MLGGLEINLVVADLWQQEAVRALQAGKDVVVLLVFLAGGMTGAWIGVSHGRHLFSTHAILVTCPTGCASDWFGSFTSLPIR